MNELWQRIEAWFTAHGPVDFYLEGFGPVPLPVGASVEGIQKAEKKLKQKKLKMGRALRLPEDVRQSYLLHNGCHGIFPWGELVEVERIPQYWARLLGRTEYLKSNFGTSCETICSTGPMKNEAWNPQWIPLTDNAGGHNYICVDLDPAAGGQVGQVIYVHLEDLVGRVVAGSFTEWLSNFAAELEAGKYKWVEEEEDLVRTDGRLYPYYE